MRQVIRETLQELSGKAVRSVPNSTAWTFPTFWRSWRDVSVVPMYRTIRNPCRIQCGPIAPTHSETLHPGALHWKRKSTRCFQLLASTGALITSPLAMLWICPWISRPSHHPRLASLKSASNCLYTILNSCKFNVNHKRSVHTPNYRKVTAFSTENPEVCFDRICNTVMLHPT